jgi:hypothetical protein
VPRTASGGRSCATNLLGCRSLSARPLSHLGEITERPARQPSENFRPPRAHAVVKRPTRFSRNHRESNCVNVPAGTRSPASRCRHTSAAGASSPAEPARHRVHQRLRHDRDLWSQAPGHDWVMAEVDDPARAAGLLVPVVHPVRTGPLEDPDVLAAEPAERLGLLPPPLDSSSSSASIESSTASKTAGA